jgi:cell division protein FtsB
MYLLEEERDFFRAQVMKLNQEVNQYIEENKNLKRKIVDLESEVSNYKTITFSKSIKI